jgi:hypothetical protein
MRVMVATAGGLFDVREGTRPLLPGRNVGALTRGLSGWWAVFDGKGLARSSDGEQWEDVAAIDSGTGACVLEAASGVFMGTSGAHLLKLESGGLRLVDGFEEADGRDQWYTPWGGPPTTRSLSADEEGWLFANVHVGGILRSKDGSESWAPTIDIHTDVHQVLAHPEDPSVVLAAAGTGFARSDDRAGTWTFSNDGLHATYCRAVAAAGSEILVSASRSHRGEQGAVYRWAADRWGQCAEGLPQSFDGNVDSHCLAASGSEVALGAPNGSVFVSSDAGTSWREAASGLPPISAVALG